MNPGYKPGERSGTSFETHERTRSHQLDLDVLSAQSNIICAHQPIIINWTQAAPNGSVRVAPGQSRLRSVKPPAVRQHRPALLTESGPPQVSELALDQIH
jgi:hypothetical protein